MSRKIMKYRDSRARRLVNKARIVLVAACSAVMTTVSALLGSGWQLFAFHWVAMAVAAFLASLSLLLEWIAAKIGRDPVTGLPDLVDVSPRAIERWTPTPSTPTLPKIPTAPPAVQATTRVAPAPVKTLPAAPAEPTYAPQTTAAPAPTGAELAAQS